MISVIIWTLAFSIATAASVVLLGQRDLISGNLFNLNNFLHLILNWKFMLSMIFALMARFSFVLLNNSLLKIQGLSQNSTTITSFITAIGFIFVAIANYYFLGERINIPQGIGAALIMVGIWVMLR